MIRSQEGPGAGAALTALPTGSERTIPSHLYRVVSSVVCDNPFPCRSAVADVAVSSTSMATSSLRSGWDVGSQGILPRERHSEDLQGSETACADECVH